MPPPSSSPQGPASVPQRAAVDALLPLSLLEAVRRMDTPEYGVDAEYVGELRSKRLGLSETVYAQIRRYSDAARRGQRVAWDEAAAVARLIGRRPDAERVFRDAGIHLAREVYRRIPGRRRWSAHMLPAVISRPLALRAMERVARRYYNGTLERTGSFVLLGVPDSVTVDAGPRAVGCAYYEASLGALLGSLLRTAGRVEHVRCAGRGEGACEWRADWRAAK